MLFEGSRDFFKTFLAFGFVEDDSKVMEALEKDVDKYLPIFDKVW